MFGPPKSRQLSESIAVSLEDLVPPNQFYRHVETTLDLSFVRDWTRELYAERGRPSIDPVVFFKLQLIMFFDGIRSERQLIETASLNLAHRWYLWSVTPPPAIGGFFQRAAPFCDLRCSSDVVHIARRWLPAQGRSAYRVGRSSLTG
jgi:hypothetical protein